ncbi:8329_t:CDS:2, partial [Acaulospora morrowiae]
YCCHKIDKRISELLKKNSKKRLRKRQLQAKAEAEGDFSYLKKKTPQAPVINGHRQPTLPKVDDNSLLPPYPLSQKPTLPEPVRMNLPPHGQNSAGLQGLQINRSDTNNHQPYKNNAKVSYQLPGSEYPQHPKRPQFYTRKTPAPGIPQRGYNNLAAMSEPIPQIHVTRSEPTSPIHSAISEPIPKLYVGRSNHVPQIDVARSEPIPQIDVTSNPVPQVNVAMSEPIPLVPQSIPQAYATKFEPVYQASITTSQSIPSIELQSTFQQQIKPIEASYDCVDIIDNYHSYSKSGVNNYNNHVNNNYPDKNNYNYNSNNYAENSFNNYNGNNYTNNNYNNFSQPIVDVERHHENNFTSSSQSHQLPNQTALPVNQSMYDYTQQQGSSKVIEEEYYYAQ